MSAPVQPFKDQFDEYKEMCRKNYEKFEKANLPAKDKTDGDGKATIVDRNTVTDTQGKSKTIGGVGGVGGAPSGSVVHAASLVQTKKRPIDEVDLTQSDDEDDLPVTKHPKVVRIEIDSDG